MVLSNSDRDFIDFYQDMLVELAYEGGSDAFEIMGIPSLDGTIASKKYPNISESIWYPKIVAALTRFTLSGLVAFDEPAEEILPRLASTKDMDIWFRYNFHLTQTGEKLIEQFKLPKTFEEFRQVIPGLREALSHIFDAHGVGFDQELPYQMRLPG